VTPSRITPFYPVSPETTQKTKYVYNIPRLQTRRRRRVQTRRRRRVQRVGTIHGIYIDDVLDGFDPEVEA